MADQWVIETEALCKRYVDVEALRGLNLQVPEGSIYGFLGRNGAGKTTTLKVLAGMVRPTSGRATVLGLPADVPGPSVEIRRRMAFVGEEKELYDFMSVEEIIRFTTSFYTGWRRDLEQHYLRAFALPLGQRVKALSRGGRTKLALLLALCRGARLLVLDEPTSGLDPAMAEEVLQALVSRVADQEMTVFFSSHQLSEVDQIADSLTILDRGRAVVAGSLDDIKQRYRRIQLVFDGVAPDASFLAPGVEQVRRQGRVISVLSSAGADRIVEEARAWSPLSVEVAPVTLKEIFLETVNAED